MPVSSKQSKAKWVAFGAVMMLLLVAALVFVLLVLGDATHSSSLEELSNS
ncbi:MAG: hypothetical protein KDB66_10015 [Solirubrobacterales bacterium]|nr:hypothetical protein [Solirubrobacterales bacterium]